MRVVKGFIAAIVLASLSCTAAHAHGGWSIGINLGDPYCYHPYYAHPYPYYYYRPYPVYVAPPAVIVQPAPLYQTAPVLQPAYSSPAEAVPTPTPLPAAAPPAPAPVQATGLRQDAAEQQLPLLDNADDHVRADAAVQLGRMKARRAVQPLAQMLAGDRSASVREAAARALGLIEDPAALPALQRAAQADDDRDVRHSAQFAAEAIRSNLPR